MVAEGAAGLARRTGRPHGGPARRIRYYGGRPAGLRAARADAVFARGGQPADRDPGGPVGGAATRLCGHRDQPSSRPSRAGSSFGGLAFDSTATTTTETCSRRTQAAASPVFSAPDVGT